MRFQLAALETEFRGEPWATPRVDLVVENYCRANIMSIEIICPPRLNGNMDPLDDHGITGIARGLL
jgi:hypothetical protein